MPLQCSLGQDEFAKAGGLQSVRLTLMTDVERTLFTKQLLVVLARIHTFRDIS
jgi:hypothetical protein